MSKTLAEVQIPGRGLDLAKVLGKDLLRIEGRISSEFGDPAFVLCRIVFTDGTVLGCEGEHDMPYVTAPYEGSAGREMEQTLNTLWAESKKDKDEDEG
jgi:hypothetical protein